jgi:M6 family metalloprotease-like protein
MKIKWFAGILFALVLAAGTVSLASAAPAAPIEITLYQPDGSGFTARQWGDEWSNGYETVDGYTILQDADGWWVYATMDAGGILIPAGGDAGRQVVGQVVPPEAAFGLRPPANRPDFINTPLQAGTDSHNIGTQPTLVLLASFSDRAGTYNGFAASMFGATNSVADYYLDASFNQLTLSPAAESYGTANDGVIGWLNLGYNHPNTGGDSGIANQLIVKNALIAADSYVNYASYDTNADGYISSNELHLVVIVAGYEASCSNLTPSVWGHRWSLNNVTPPTLDGKILGDDTHNGGYAQFGEIHGDHQATIGIMVHELGHDITWPDLYDTDNSSDGVGSWSIMGSGSWNYTTGNYFGSSPALPDAWLKWYQGWITPTAVNGTLTHQAIAQAETNPTAFLLRPNPGGVNWEFGQYSGTGEFFLVENRQLTGYDAGLPGCGLLIWHIDETVTYTNSANANEDHPLVKLMQADGLDELLKGDSQDIERGDAGDPFPGAAVNTAFTYSSNPNSRLYSGADSLASVTAISAGCAATKTATLTYGSTTSVQNLFLPLVRKNPLLTKYRIAGQILTNQNTPLANVTVSCGAWTAVTNANGYYSIGNLVAGDYIIQPALHGYSFLPEYYSFSIQSDMSGVNFIGTPSTPSCNDLILNGGFEYEGDWILPITPYPADYSKAEVHGGSWSMRTGITNAWDNIYSYSSVQQEITLPNNASSAELIFWLHASSGESPLKAIPAQVRQSQFGTLAMYGDVQYGIILDEDGNWIDTFVWQRTNDQRWKKYKIDLLDLNGHNYAGETIKIHIGTYNDGYDGITALFVDDVSVLICP